MSKLAILITSLCFSVSCSSIPVPTVDSGLARVQIREFITNNQELKMRVTTINEVESGRVVFSFKKKSFGVNRVILPAGEYDITYICYKDAQRLTILQKELNYPVYTERYKIAPGEDLSLTHRFIYNIKYGNRECSKICVNSVNLHQTKKV